MNTWRSKYYDKKRPYFLNLTVPESPRPLKWCSVKAAFLGFEVAAVDGVTYDRRYTKCTIRSNPLFDSTFLNEDIYVAKTDGAVGLNNALSSRYSDKKTRGLLLLPLPEHPRPLK